MDKDLSTGFTLHLMKQLCFQLNVQFVIVKMKKQVNC